MKPGDHANLTPVAPSFDDAVTNAARIEAAQLCEATAKGLWSETYHGLPEQAIAALRKLRAAEIVTQDCGLNMIAIASRDIDPQQILLGNEDCRYLEKVGVCMLSAMSGVGKSTWLLQAGARWAAGLSAFGLPAAKPLRILFYQAENPDNDMTQLCSQALQGLDAHARDLIAENTKLVHIPGKTGEAFLDLVRGDASVFKPDLICIDPLAGFAPGDLCNPSVVQNFCRQGLNGIAVDYQCGLFILHHTPKPQKQQNKPQQAYA